MYLPESEDFRRPIGRTLSLDINIRSTPLYAPVLFDLGTESIPAVKLGDSNGVSISCVFDDSDFITLYSDACSYR